MRILFQGDSVTDAGRNREDPMDLGPGYASVAASLLREAFPETDFTFFNRGIGGNRTEHLVQRLQSDFLDLKPDIVTILVGVNDSWHIFDKYALVNTTHEMTEQNYRTVLEALKARNIPVIMMEPFCLPTPATQEFRMDLYGKIEVIRRLAREYAVAYLPLDGLAQAEGVAHGTLYLADDGIHPNTEGRKWLGNLVAEALKPVIAEKLERSSC